jgi:ribosomal-protein-alanine N-acetyltransferase
VADDFQGLAPVLETHRLSLRPLQTEDAEAIFTLGSDPEVTRYVFWPRHETVENSRAFVAWLSGVKFRAWAMHRRTQPGAIGIVFLHSLNAHHRKAELSMHVTRSCWGQGFATEAGSAVLREALGPMKLNRIEATCMVPNEASARVLAKLGLIQEGVLRQSHQRKDHFFDMKLFAILATDLAQMPSP